MYGGDEVGAVVIDFGSCNLKAGYAGEDSPKAVLPSRVGLLISHGHDKENVVGNGHTAVGDDDAADAPSTSSAAAAASQKKTYYAGINSLAYRRDNMEVISPFKDGIVVDWEAAEKVLHHAFKSCLMIDPSEHPILLSEASFSDSVAKETGKSGSHRERFAQMMFEKFQVPALFISKNAALSAFSVGRSTGIVLDVGGSVTSATAVHDGYVLKKGIVKSRVAGEAITEMLQQAVEKKHGPVRPHYSFTRKPVPGKEGEFVVTNVDVKKTTESYKKYLQQNIIRDLKEAVCRVSDQPFDPTASSPPSASYELPDGTVVKLATEHFIGPEMLFRPNLLYTTEGGDETGWRNTAGVQRLVQEAIGKCDADIRKELYGNIILTGASSLFPNFKERLDKEMADLAPVEKYKAKVHVAPSAAERKFSVFIGGSIVASLGSFQQMWISRQEYQEMGPMSLDKRCP